MPNAHTAGQFTHMGHSDAILKDIRDTLLRLHYVHPENERSYIMPLLLCYVFMYAYHFCAIRGVPKAFALFE